MSLCINSDQHINEGDALIEVPDNWEGMNDAGSMRVTCPLCQETIALKLCIHTGNIGFHYQEHEQAA